MANDTIKKSLVNAFQELPEKIRDWLTSERVTYTVIEINKRFAFFGEDLKVIPRLIARLVLKDLAPENFIKELAEQLGIDRNAAEAITQDIFQRILRPIDLPLKEIQVFPVLMLEKETNVSAGPTVEQAKPEKPASPPLVQLPPAELATKPAQPASPIPSLIQTQEMAHPEEKPTYVKPTPQQRTAPPIAPRPTQPAPLQPPVIKIPINVTAPKPPLPPIPPTPPNLPKK